MKIFQQWIAIKSNLNPLDDRPEMVKKGVQYEKRTEPRAETENTSKLKPPEKKRMV